jgi:chemotaxis response regulator CheB
MPGEAIELGGVTHVLPAEKIAETLVSIVKRRQAAGGHQ